MEINTYYIKYALVYFLSYLPNYLLSFWAGMVLHIGLEGAEIIKFL